MKPDARLQLNAHSAHQAVDLYAVRVRGIRKVFDELEAIRDVSLDVANGEFVSLLGPSGCGKSTLLMMVAGLLFPTSGEVILADTPVRGPRRDVGVVFQNPVLLPWRSVLDNVLLPIEFLRLPVEEYRARAMELLKMVKLKEFAGALPRQLSGGMRQRASICRALIHDPAILLMDEPFSALDAITRDDMNVMMLDLWQRYHKTALFVTHSIRESVLLADRVLVLGGRPATIIDDVTIPFARPRDVELAETAEFTA